MSATGRPKSSALAAASRIVCGSRTSASMYVQAPSDALVSSARACTSTSGSLSTYTIRDSGAIRWATSWVLSAVGSPVPTSRNWRMSASPARCLTARARKARTARATTVMSG